MIMTSKFDITMQNVLIHTYIKSGIKVIPTQYKSPELNMKLGLSNKNVQQQMMKNYNSMKQIYNMYKELY